MSDQKSESPMVPVDAAAHPPCPNCSAPVTPKLKAKGRMHRFTREMLTINHKAKLFRFSARERLFIVKMIETGNAKIAAAEIGISDMTAWRYLHKPAIADFIEARWEEEAAAAGTTLKNHIAWLRKIRDTSPRDEALRAAAQLTRLLTPPGSGMRISMIQNNLPPSPYDRMSTEELVEGLRERQAIIETIEVRNPPNGGA